MESLRSHFIILYIVVLMCLLEIGFEYGNLLIKKTLAYNIIGIMKGYSQIHIILPGEGRYKLYPSN